MKTILTRITNEQAQKEIRYLPWVAAITSIVPLFAFWFIAIAGFALSGRGLLLTFHKGLAAEPHLVWYRVLFICCGVVSFVISVLFINR